MSEQTSVSRLFLSCDLTGSTAFKQLEHDAQSPWQKVFLQFYREFPQTLYKLQVEDGRQHLNFELWKPVGDELIFTCAVSSEIEIFEAIDVWLKTMDRYRAESLDDTPLGVKGGAFVGTFPGPDHESSIPRQPLSEQSQLDVVALNFEALKKRDHSTYLFDYFGPSIDTGFRVVGQSSARYFTLSVEVAFALASLHKHPGPDAASYQQTGRLTYVGKESLKGVWGGRTYPLFAIDLEAESEINQAFRGFEPERWDVPKIYELCKACYTSESWPFAIYLPRGKNDYFKAEPSDPLSGYVMAEDPAGVEDDPSEPFSPSTMKPHPPLE